MKYRFSVKSMVGGVCVGLCLLLLVAFYANSTPEAITVRERSDQIVFGLYLTGIISFPAGMFFELICRSIYGDLWYR